MTTIRRPLLATTLCLLLAAIAPVAAQAADDAATPVLAAAHVTTGYDTWDKADEIAVQLADGDTFAAEGVAIDGGTVLITAPGSYRISGTLSDGQLLVDSESDGLVRLILDGVDITSSTGAAIAILEADETVIWLADGSQNRLADPADYTFADPEEDEPNATLFSKDDLTIAGSGELTVTGSYNDGIASKDGLVITDGTISVTVADDGIRGKDYLVISGGSLDVDAGGDALKSDEEDDASLGYIAITGGTLDLRAGSDGIEAVTAVLVEDGDITIAADDDGIHSEAWLEISGGTVDVTRSYEGIEGAQIVISGGATSVVAEDDGLNVSGGDGAQSADALGGPGGRRGGGFETPIEGLFVEVSGGTLVIDADGDGFDSNGSAAVSGGTIVISGPTSNGNGALDVNGDLLVSGGTILAAGSAGMAESPSAASAQATLALRFSGNVPAGTVVRIEAEEGSPVLTWQASKPFQSLVLSSPDIAAGESYEVLLDGEVSGADLGGLYLDPDYSGGTSVGTISAQG